MSPLSGRTPKKASVGGRSPSTVQSVFHGFSSELATGYAAGYGSLRASCRVLPDPQFRRELPSSVTRPSPSGPARRGNRDTSSYTRRPPRDHRGIRSSSTARPSPNAPSELDGRGTPPERVKRSTYCRPRTSVTHFVRRSIVGVRFLGVRRLCPIRWDGIRYLRGGSLLEFLIYVPRGRAWRTERGTSIRDPDQSI